VHAKDSDIIQQVFVQVRLGLAINGGRDHQIKVKAFPNIQVGNWKDWQPKEAIKGEGEELQSNLVLDEVEILVSKMPVDDSDDTVDFGQTIIVDVE
jgi:hypothetical protein